MLTDNGTLSEGNTQACYDIAIEDDNVIELRELFYVSLTTLPGHIENRVTINPNVSSVAIIDNDGKNTLILKSADTPQNPLHRASDWF